MTNFEKFMEIYREELTNAVKSFPEDYSWPIENVPIVAEKMAAAFRANTFNKDGIAIKVTCKRLKIPYTYKGINNYLNG